MSISLKAHSRFVGARIISEQRAQYLDDKASHRLAIKARVHVDVVHALRHSITYRAAAFEPLNRTQGGRYAFSFDTLVRLARTLDTLKSAESAEGLIGHYTTLQDRIAAALQERPAPTAAGPDVVHESQRRNLTHLFHADGSSSRLAGGWRLASTVAARGIHIFSKSLKDAAQNPFNISGVKAARHAREAAAARAALAARRMPQVTLQLEATPEGAWLQEMQADYDLLREPPKAAPPPTVIEPAVNVTKSKAQQAQEPLRSKEADDDSATIRAAGIADVNDDSATIRAPSPAPEEIAHEVGREIAAALMALSAKLDALMPHVPAPRDASKQDLARLAAQRRGALDAALRAVVWQKNAAGKLTTPYANLPELQRSILADTELALQYAVFKQLRFDFKTGLEAYSPLLNPYPEQEPDYAKLFVGLREAAMARALDAWLQTIGRPLASTKARAEAIRCALQLMSQHRALTAGDNSPYAAHPALQKAIVDNEPLAMTYALFKQVSNAVEANEPVVLRPLREAYPSVEASFAGLFMTMLSSWQR